jgi:hypothetical protein
MHMSRLIHAVIILWVLSFTFSNPAAGQPATDHRQLQRFPAAWRYTLYAHPNLLSDFNRVDGLVQSLAIHARVPTAFDRPPFVAVFSRVDIHTTELPHYRVRGGAVGVSSHLPCSQLGDRDGWWASLSADYHKQTVSPDDWIVGRTENAIAALLTKHDYRNYHQIEGYTVSATAQFVPQSQKLTFTAQAAWHDDQHHPLANATQWSLLPWSKSYRPNYIAARGQEHMLSFAVGVEIRDTPRYPRRSVHFLMTGEIAGNRLGGDFEYDGVLGEIKLRWATVSSQRLALRIRVGARTGELAEQHELRLGGIGTLRGAPHRIGSDLLGRLDFFPFTAGVVRKVLPIIDLGLLYDVGSAFRAQTTDNLLAGWSAGKGQDNWGIFLSIADDLMRIEWASTLFLGHDYSNVLRCRLGWRL